MLITFLSSEKLSPSIHTFYFTRPPALRYEPGQFIELTLPGVTQNGSSRWFTLSSSPTEDMLAITTKIPEQPNAYKAGLLALRPGDAAETSDPMGDFIVPMDSSRPLVWIAAGIGITPFRSMVKWLSDSGTSRNTTLLYGVRHEADLVYIDCFRQASFVSVHTLVSAKTSTADIASGHLSADYILQRMPEGQDALFYMAGPEHLVEKLGDDLVAAGVPALSIVTDFFAGYGGG